MLTFEAIQRANESIQTMDIKGKEYALVNQRIKAFRMICPDGTIETEMLSNENGVCVFKATIKEVDLVLGTGHAYEKESSSYINKTSYIENCETSAIGRALAACGFGIDTSVASYEEVANAIKNQETPAKGSTTARKASQDSVTYILSNATENELKRIAECYKVEQISDLTEEQATKSIISINRRKAGEGNVL